MLRGFPYSLIQYSIAVEQILKGVYSPKEYGESVHITGWQIGHQKEVTECILNYDGKSLRKKLCK